MIRSGNIDNLIENNFAWDAVVLPLNLGASLAAVLQTGWGAPYPGYLVGVSVYVATVTDADDSVRVDVQKNGVSAALVNPGIADSVITPVLAAPVRFAAGDKLQVVATTGVGDALVGSITLLVRPLLGPEV